MWRMELVDSRLTFPKEPVPRVLSIMYCPTLGFCLVEAPLDDDCRGYVPGGRVPIGAGGAGRVAMLEEGGSVIR